MMKKCSFLFSSLVCFTVLPELLLSLPKDPSVVAGDVTIHNQQSNTMVIKASDKSIVNFRSFDVQKGEKVQFIQPSSKSAVLNRVQGNKASKILGQIESNGRVVLVNPNGMYFGPHASVRVGSLIASALDISNDDFIKDQYTFLLQNKDYLAEIRNDGLLAASPEGAIVLMAPVVRNFGTIQARAGKVVVAAGEKVTLDFHGDGLLNFAVEGDLKGAVIQHLGQIQAEGGEVTMRLPTAKRAIHEVINRDGVERGEVFVKEHGEIFLVSASSILAKKVSLEGNSLSVDGHIDVSNSSGRGGEITLLGAEINLRGARMDASGLTGGGQVLIGGEYQGGGSTPYASSVFMDSSSHVLANAIDEGNGGSVVLWSLKETEFEGNIFAQGGFHSGNGGIVETSSIDNLTCLNGHVNTSAASGRMGEWLLDPSILNIVLGGGAGPSLCESGNIGVDSFTSSTTGVVLCANEINQNVPITMTVEDSGLLFRAPLGEVGVLNLNGGDITTRKGPIVVENLTTIVKVDTAFDTTAGGVFPVGASLAFEQINSQEGEANAITINAGQSRVEVGNIGTVSRLGAVTVYAETTLINSIITDNSPIIIASSLLLKGDSILNTGLGQGSITLQEVDSLIPGNGRLRIRAGLGSVVMGGVGTSNPLGNFSILSAEPSVIVGNIITQNGDVNIVPSLLLKGPIKLIKTYSDLNTLLSGDVTLGDITASAPNVSSLSIQTGLKGSITTGNIGSSQRPLDELTIDTNQPLSLGKVFADDLTIDGHSGNLVLEGLISLSRNLNVAGAGVLINAPIDANNISIIARDSIAYKTTTAYPITAGTPGLVLLNPARGDLGTSITPMEISTSGPVKVGGSNVYIDLIGETKTVEYIASNKPCLLRFKGIEYPCAAGILRTFNAARTKIVRNLLIGDSPTILLGLLSPLPFPYANKGIQYSWGNPILASSDFRLPITTPWNNNL
jgi:filamentous hemagglutinin family protein